MRDLSLFSGAGGGLLGTKLLGWETIGYVEIDEYCQRILRARIDDGILDRAPIFADIREFLKSGAAREYRGLADVVTAGFPCQPFSVAGSQKADRDDRNLWPETVAVLREVRPRFAFLENVPGLLARSHGYFGRVLGDLAEIGYDARWTVLSAADCGAPHLRKRLWILAYAGHGTFTDVCEDVSHAIRPDLRDESGRCGGTHGTDTAEPGDDGEEEPVADANSTRHAHRQECETRCKCSSGGNTAYNCGQGAMGESKRLRQLQSQGCESDERGWIGDTGLWATEPDVGRVAHGVASRVDRLRALGNGQVPAVVAEAWRILSNDTGGC